jgi:broad specificity phosphatase PhoE
LFLPLLRERGAGVFEGLPLATVAAACTAQGGPPRRFRPEGGESWEDVRARAKDFLLLCVVRPCRCWAMRKAAD